MTNYKFDYSQYKKRINNKTSLPFSIIIFLIIVLMGAICFICKPSNNVNFYFLEVNCFFSYSDANICANEITNLNAGGYVYFNGKYHVLACAYLNEKDATQAKENIKEQYPNAKVFKLSSTEFNKNSFKTKESDAICYAINANQKVIEKLFNLIVELDTNSLTEEQAKREIETLKNNYISSTDNFNTIFRTNKKLTKQKEKISSYVSTLKQLKHAENISQSLKYCLIKISILHYSFLEGFC